MHMWFWNFSNLTRHPSSILSHLGTAVGVLQGIINAFRDYILQFVKPLSSIAKALPKRLSVFLSLGYQ